MEESVSKGAQAAQGVVRDGSYSIAIDADRAIVRDVLEALPNASLRLGVGQGLGLGLGLGPRRGLGEIFTYVQGRAEELIFQEAVNKGLGGERDDQEVRDIRPGSLRVLLHCFTDKRFLEVLEDFRSGRMRERLSEEFLIIGIETEGLKVEIKNIEEVEERAAGIKNR